MYKLLALMFALIAYTTSYSQKKIFPADPNKTYQLYFIDPEFHLPTSDKEIKEYIIRTELIGTELQFIMQFDTTSSFLISDKEKIMKIANTWDGEYAAGTYFCGYDYCIYVVEDGRIVDELKVNLECKQVVSMRNGVIDYKTDPFKVLDKSTRVSSLDLEKNPPKAFMEKLEKIPNLFLAQATYPSESLRYFTVNTMQLNSLINSTIMTALEKYRIKN